MKWEWFAVGVFLGWMLGVVFAVRFLTPMPYHPTPRLMCMRDFRDVDWWGPRRSFYHPSVDGSCVGGGTLYEVDVGVGQ